MDVLGVEEEDGHPWKLWGFTSALSGVFMSTKHEVRCDFYTHYAPVRCSSKLQEMW
jgi:hypothetical protein